MSLSNLPTAVMQMATMTCSLTDADLGQPYAWRKHDEGARLGILGTVQELRQLAVGLGQQRAAENRPLTAVQQVLAQNHRGFRDLQAVFLGVTDAEYDQEPGPGEWPLRIVLGHIVAAERWFHTLAAVGLVHFEAGETPPPLADEAPETVAGPYEAFNQIMEAGSLAEMMAYYEKLHFLSWQNFAGISEAALAAPSPLWWEEETYSLQYRLHRFDAHRRQHLIQAEKTLDQIGKPATEGQRLARLLLNALAEVESMTVGAEDLEESRGAELAQAVSQRVEEITAVVEAARDLETAVKSGQSQTVGRILQASPRLANACDQSRLPLVLTAIYHNHPDIARRFVEAGARLSIFSAAALGDLAKVQAHLEAWEGWLQEYNLDGFTPLQLACFFGHEAVALWLIEQGADVTAVAQNNMRITPVHAAAAKANLAVLRALLQKGSDVNATQQRNFTALHEAARTNNVAMAQLCLEFGADPGIQSEAGQTPLDLALAEGSQDVAQLLQEVTHGSG